MTQSIVLAALFALFTGGASAAPGTLVVVGGGEKGSIFHAELLKAAGGPAARILIIPQASGAPDAGKSSEKTFRGLGVERVEILSLDDKAKAREAIQNSDGIWIPGGNQGRLMNELSKTEVVTAIRERFARGAPVGGSSAGAAILSRSMITGNPDAAKPAGTPPPISEGLALWPEAIVDQHFTERNRLSRLENAVIAHPTLIGVGIDENTAVIVKDHQFEVLGAGSVRVVAMDRPTANSKSESASAKPAITVLKAGAKFDLNKKRLQPAAK